MAPSPIQEIKSELLEAKQIRLFLKRDDLIHPIISGNKWRKLKYNLTEASDLKHTTLLTFGGAFSNHIQAVAAAGKLYGFKTIGIIRGEKVLPLNPTLLFAEEQGMKLHFITRTTYQQKYTLAFQEALQTQFGNFYMLPEGGTNELALKGCAEIIGELEAQLSSFPTYIATCCGTGGTIAGMIKGSEGKQTHILGIAALKGDFLTKEVENLLITSALTKLAKWSILHEYHFGGYAKFNPTLIDFINNFKQDYQIPLDPIYTGKLLFGIFDLVKNDFFPKGSTVAVLHTGGLQGIAGFNERYSGLVIG